MLIFRRASEFRLRRGSSRMDVVVTLLIALLLTTLLLPACVQQKRKARAHECLHNIRNVGQAVIAYEVSSGQIPPLVGETEGITSGKMDIGWSIMLLPALDCSALFKSIKTHIPQDANARTTISEVDRVWLPTFTCHEDVDSDSKPGGLSYVVNAGFMSREIYHGDPTGSHRLGSLSWDGNSVVGEPADVYVSVATGVFWRPDPAGLNWNFAGISESDGLDSTLLVTENLQAGNWYDTDTARISFGLPVEAKGGQVPFGSGQYFESVEKPLNTQFAGGSLATAKDRDWLINCDLKAKVGLRPRPSSNHVDGVNVIMCSGAARFLSQTIDPHVYAKLLTPNGSHFGEGELSQRDF